MIIVRAYTILFNASKEPLLYNPRIVAKWNLSTVEGFGIDVGSPKAWRTFLASYRTKKDKLLPSKTPAGDDIVYSITTWGNLPEMYWPLFPVKQAVSFFPGYDKDGNRRSEKFFGRIR